MSEHTPGPWTYAPLERGGFKIVPKDDPSFKICRIENAITYLMDFDERAEPDARLIAAAPDMLAALKEADSFFEGGENHGCHDHQMIRAAIAKATAA